MMIPPRHWLPSPGGPEWKLACVYTSGPPGMAPTDTTVTSVVPGGPPPAPPIPAVVKQKQGMQAAQLSVGPPVVDDKMKRKREKARIRQALRRKRKRAQAMDWGTVASNAVYMNNADQSNPLLKIMGDSLRVLPDLRLLRGTSQVPPLLHINFANVIPGAQVSQPGSMAQSQNLADMLTRIFANQPQSQDDSMRKTIEISPQTQGWEWLSNVESSLVSLLQRTLYFKWSVLETNLDSKGSLQTWHYDFPDQRRQRCASLNINLSNVKATTYFHIGCWTKPPPVSFHKNEGLLYGGFLHAAGSPEEVDRKGVKVMHEVQAEIAFARSDLSNSTIEIRPTNTLAAHRI
ncbi:hypothetical protein AAMO2058_001575100 [Amorphochlora amoebiformis]